MLRMVMGFHIYTIQANRKQYMQTVQQIHIFEAIPYKCQVWILQLEKQAQQSTNLEQ